MSESALLDTSFFIRLLDSSKDLHQNAKGCFKHLLERKIYPVISTIAIAEYCVRGEISDLPLKNLQILPFNVEHSKRAAEFIRIVLSKRDENLKNIKRVIIPNDSKLLAQADAEKQIKYYITADKESKSIYDTIKANSTVNFQFIDLHTPFKESFGLLDLPDT